MSAIFHVDVKTEGLMGKYLAKVKRIRAEANVGFKSTATYPNGIPVAYVAYLNEFGGHNPPRPFMKRTFEKECKKWTNIVRVVLSKDGLSQNSAKIALGRAGQTAVADIQKTIKAWNPNDPRANKPATIRAKQRKTEGVRGKNLVKTNPYRVLLDTSKMIDSVTSEVVE